MSGKGHAERRAELQTLAYGQSTTPEERAAALRAREELDRLDVPHGHRRVEPPKTAAPSEPGSPAEPGAGAEPGAAAEPDATADGDAATEAGRSRPRRRRILVVASLMVVALGVGAFVAGTAYERHRLVALASAANGSFGNAATSDGTFGGAPDDSAATSRLAAGDPATVSDPVTAARRWFTSKQSSADKYDLEFGGAGLFRLSSTRLIADSPRLGKVWVAEKDGGGFCLISLAPEPGSDARAGAISCATEAQYKDKGVALMGDAVSITWMGASLDVSLSS